jgi:hypothetical protein
MPKIKNIWDEEVNCVVLPLQIEGKRYIYGFKCIHRHRGILGVADTKEPVVGYGVNTCSLTSSSGSSGAGKMVTNVNVEIRQLSVEIK